MSREKPQRVCDVCKYDGGWHLDDPDHPTRCPNYLAADEQERLRTVAAEYRADERSKAATAAQAIMRDLAHVHAELSANDCRAVFEQARVPSSLIGYAFRWAKSEQLIEETGRFVQSTEKTTRHRIAVWASLVYRGAARGRAS